MPPHTLSQREFKPRENRAMFSFLKICSSYLFYKINMGTVDRIWKIQKSPKEKVLNLYHPEPGDNHL